ncbi:hypothetical protein LS70_005725 [Helicobacter sp. MIT 11-5569]|uniref:flagellar basal body rod C-terminal domain-containing protein n=1 Tax=Helicobacter sp. MIT 11-5569 TaxID=1548151 RepID=UPI00051F9ADE|nr:flagellar basal body rod C-terminal domain-containing protein [Helicobacter sp. MIT 11-5569]TLD83247.1 hypothetical protein LS70_005725 [Helicobacter sp. MIT 11-5569]
MMVSPSYGYDAFSVAQSGMSANVTSGTLETSNVNLTDQMTQQISAQNSVEANAQSVKTADSMMQSLLDIKA